MPVDRKRRSRGRTVPRARGGCRSSHWGWRPSLSGSARPYSLGGREANTSSDRLTRQRWRGWAPTDAIFLVAVVGIYFVATRAGLPEWTVALLELAVALLLVGFIFARLSGQISPVRCRPCRDTPGARLDGSR